MANKIVNQDSTILIMQKDEFKNILKHRIVEGKELLKINVPFRNPATYYGNFHYPDLSKKSLNEKFKEFKNAFRKWSDFYSKLLRRTFSPLKTNISNHSIRMPLSFHGIVYSIYLKSKLLVYTTRKEGQTVFILYFHC